MIALLTAVIGVPGAIVAVVQIWTMVVGTAEGGGQPPASADELVTNSPSVPILSPSSAPPSSAGPVAVQLSFDAFDRKDLETGLSYTLSGWMSPTVPGSAVEILADGTVVGEGVVGQDGAVDVIVQFAVAGSAVELVARSEATALIDDASFTIGSVDVYGWRYLSDAETTSNSKNYTTKGTWQLKGTSYDRSIAFLWSAASFGGWRNGDATYNLAAKCIRFVATAGVDDNAAGDEAQWSFRLAAGGREEESGFISVFNPKELQLELRGAPRLTISATRFDPDQDQWRPYKGDAVLGNPRVLCLP